MDYKALRQIYTETSDALAEQRLSDAMALVEGLLHSLADSNMIDSLYSLRQNYEALLRFVFTSGSVPPDISNQTQSIGRQLIILLNKAAAQWLTTDRSSALGRKYYVVSSTAHNHSFDELLETTRRQPEESEAFYTAADEAATRLWLFPVDAQACGDQIVNHPSVFVQSLFAAALTCSLLFAFDPQKLTLLLKLDNAAALLVAEEPSNQLHKALAARCVTGLLLTYNCHSALINYFPHLQQPLQAALDRVGHDLPMIWMALLKASVTQKVNEEVDSILPELKDAIEQQLTAMGNDFSDTRISEAGESMFDEKMFDRMAGHARKIDDLRRDGFDVNYVNAANLKRFDFFHEAIHWLYPLSLKVPWVNKLLYDENGNLDKATMGVMHHSYFCESDCYSYIAAMLYTRGKNSTIMNRLRHQLNEIGDALYDDTIINPPQHLYINYVQSLYRFLNLQTEGKELCNHITLKDTQLTQYAWMAGYLHDDDVVEAARVLTRMGHADYALTMLTFWQQRSGSSAQLLLQLGYAYMQTSQWSLALQAFNQSQLIDDSQSDIQVLKARCYQALRQWTNALECLLQHEAGHSEDPSAIRAVGNCMIRLERWEEAAQRFFKLEFLGKATPAVMRSIAWCLLRQGKLEKAEHYYRQLCAANTPLWEDQLNLSHAIMLQGRLHDALSEYRRFVSLFNTSDNKNGTAGWYAHMNEDYAPILAAHVPPATWHMLTDAISIEAL